MVSSHLQCPLITQKQGISEEGGRIHGELVQTPGRRNMCWSCGSDGKLVQTSTGGLTLHSLCFLISAPLEVTSSTRETLLSLVESHLGFHTEVPLH